MDAHSNCQTTIGASPPARCSGQHLDSPDLPMADSQTTIPFQVMKGARWQLAYPSACNNTMYSFAGVQAGGRSVQVEGAGNERQWMPYSAYKEFKIQTMPRAGPSGYHQ
jgi:hypothetical protein